MFDLKGKCRGGITAARSRAKCKKGEGKSDDLTAACHFCWFPAWLNLPTLKMEAIFRRNFGLSPNYMALQLSRSYSSKLHYVLDM